MYTVIYRRFTKLAFIAAMATAAAMVLIFPVFAETVDLEQAQQLFEGVDPEQATAIGLSPGVGLQVSQAEVTAKKEADVEQMEAMAGTMAPSGLAAIGGKSGYVWANDPTSASYTPIAIYSNNSGGGAIQITRSAVGHYAVQFGGLGGSATAGGHVQVTGYGPDNADCKVRSWSSFGNNFTANVDCYSPNGAAVDARYTVLVVWP